MTALFPIAYEVAVVNNFPKAIFLKISESLKQEIDISISRKLRKLNIISSCLHDFFTKNTINTKIYSERLKAIANEPAQLLITNQKKLDQEILVLFEFCF